MAVDKRSIWQIVCVRFFTSQSTHEAEYVHLSVHSQMNQKELISISLLFFTFPNKLNTNSQCSGFLTKTTTTTTFTATHKRYSVENVHDKNLITQQKWWNKRNEKYTIQTHGVRQLMSNIKNERTNRKKNEFRYPYYECVQYCIFGVYKNKYREENKEKKKLCANEKYM